jgi:protein TonB
MPSAIPLPDLVPPGTPALPWTHDPWPGLPGMPGDTGVVPGGAALPLDARVVEDPPVLLAHPAVRYPEVLRQAGIEGEVMIEAVLDTLGRVETGSARVVRGAHALMDAEAMSVVGGSRYRPGRMGSHAVRVRIQVPVRFALRR